jgi:hypothetical protein
MTEFITIIKKHGALGVLAMWLWFTNTRVEKLEQKLYDCYQSSRVMEQTKEHSKLVELDKLYAILPSKIKRKYETIRERNA